MTRLGLISAETRMSANRSTVGDRIERELKLKEEIRHRLEAICSNLSPDEFQELIDKIAGNQLKSEYRPFQFGPDARLDGAAKGLESRPRPRRRA